MTHFDDLIAAHGRHGYAADPPWARALAALILLALLLSI